MADITTKAGLALRYEDLTQTERDVFAEWCSCTPKTGGQERCLEWFATMRAEAVRAERARLAEAVRGLTTYDDPGVPECDLMLYRDDVLALLEGEA